MTVMTTNTLQFRPQRNRRKTPPTAADWWKKPLLWALLFANITIAIDTFVPSLVELILKAV